MQSETDQSGTCGVSGGLFHDDVPALLRPAPTLDRYIHGAFAHYWVDQPRGRGTIDPIGPVLSRCSCQAGVSPVRIFLSKIKVSGHKLFAKRNGLFTS